MAIRKHALLAPPLLAAALLTGPQTGWPAPTVGEYDVKAAFLYNFTKFVDWPSSVFANDRDTLTVCVLGDDPFRGSLQRVAGEDVEGRQLIVLRARSDFLSRPGGCQILFISRSEAQRLSQVLAAVRDHPVLTVSDTEGFLEQGGIINFVLQGSKIRFEINQESAERAGLKISSKLLRLASRIVPGGRPGP